MDVPRVVFSPVRQLSKPPCCPWTPEIKSQGDVCRQAKDSHVKRGVEYTAMQFLVGGIQHILALNQGESVCLSQTYVESTIKLTT